MQPSGRSFEVGEDDVILDVALAHGIRMPHGCRAGSCKSCRAKVVSGTADVGRVFPAPRFMLRTRQFDGYTLLCRASASSDLVIEVDEQPRVHEARRLKSTVESVERAARDVAILRLKLDIADALNFVAGQYVELLLADGVRRSYSIANAPAAAGNDALEFHVRHLPGGLFTDRLFGGLAAGESLDIEAPRGAFYLRESARPALMLASGTGYAPIRSILLDVLPLRQGRPFVLYWGARTRADLYRLEEAQALASEHADLRFVPVLSEPDPDWDGRRGLVHEAVMQDLPDLSNWQVYACGAPPMVDAAQRDFTRQCRLEMADFFSDAFVSQADMARA